MDILFILKLEKDIGQSIAEYSILIVAIVAVMVFAINGPIKNSLNRTVNGTIETIRNSVNALIP